MYIFILTALLTLSAPASAGGPILPNLPDVVEKVLPGVLNISSIKILRTSKIVMDDFFRLFQIPQEIPQTSLGSGFLISEDGFALTNYHVIEEADELLVTLVDKKNLKARVVGKDMKTDIALIRVLDIDKKIKPVPLGDSSKVRLAESVFSVGNPMALKHSVASGIISAKDRSLGVGPLNNLFQTDTVTNPGNSGGPLFNLKGEVIGITSAIKSNTGSNIGLGFAIPINEAKKILDKLKQYGRVPRPWLGFIGQELNTQLQAAYALPTSSGVFVLNLVRGSPADRGGLEGGDIILEVNKRAVTQNSEVEEEMNKLQPNDSISLTLFRGKAKKSLTIKMKEWPNNSELPREVI